MDARSSHRALCALSHQNLPKPSVRGIQCESLAEEVVGAVVVHKGLKATQRRTAVVQHKSCSKLRWRVSRTTPCCCRSGAKRFAATWRCCASNAVCTWQPPERLPTAGGAACASCCVSQLLCLLTGHSLGQTTVWGCGGSMRRGCCPKREHHGEPCPVEDCRCCGGGQATSNELTSEVNNLQHDTMTSTSAMREPTRCVCPVYLLDSMIPLPAPA